jgi:hypothetical protein
VTIAFGCLVILHGAAFIIFRTNAHTVWWFQVHGKFLGWEIGEGDVDSRYNILLIPVAHATAN